MAEKYSYTNWFKTTTSICLVGIGLYLLIRPNSSLSLLTLVIGASIVVSGFNDIAESKEGTGRFGSITFGLLCMAGGILVILSSNITVKTLALFGGIYLIAHGGWRCYRALKIGTGKIANTALGLGSIGVGIISLSWPNVTILVLAIIFGIRTVFYGGVLGWSVYKLQSRNN